MLRRETQHILESCRGYLSASMEKMMKQWTSMEKVVKRWRGLFRQPLVDDLEEEPLLFFESEEAAPSNLMVEGAAASPQRLRLSFPKRTIYDFCHLLPPFEDDPDRLDRMRWQVKEAMRLAIFDRSSADESIIGFANLIVLCGFNARLESPQALVEPLEAVELAEKYYRRSLAWKSAMEAGRPEDERINLSKAVYSSENAILSVFSGLRALYVYAASPKPEPEPEPEPVEPVPPPKAETDVPLPDPAVAQNGAGDPAAGQNGAADPTASENGTVEPEEKHEPTAEELLKLELISSPARLFEYREEKYLELKQKSRFEDAYVTYKEKLPERTSDDRHRGDEGRGGFSMDAMLQFAQAMSLINGGGARMTVPAGDAASADTGPPPIKKIQRKLRTDGFTIKDKERLIEIIYSCEANGTRFDRDYETMEAMVYRKPHQVVMMLAEKVEDPVLFL
jgi:hypothetical protein